MNAELVERVRKMLEEKHSIDEVKSDLVSEGFLEDDVVEVIQEIKGVERTSEEKKNINLFTIKEIFDRIGYGFASVQFINVLFSLAGAGFFLIGVINGLKTILSLIISSFLQEYSKVRRISNKFMSKAGILFGLSFLFIAMAIVIKSLPLFSIALLIGSIGVVTYGDLYNKLTERCLKKEKLSKFLLSISHYGVMITAASLLLSGFLFDKFPATNASHVVLFGKSLPIYGYLIAFEITAITFILSGYVLNFIKERSIEPGETKRFISSYFARIRGQAKIFVKNKYLLILLLAGSITGLVQVLGNSYYGIFIYDKFQNVALGGFTNLAVILVLAILVSFIGPAFSEYLNKKVGLAPTLVFGSLLLAMMPLVAVYNPHFLSIGLANALSVLGAAILGVGQGLLIRKLLNEEQRKLYFAALSIAVVVPFIILIPLGAWLAQSFGLLLFFKVLAAIVLFLAAPLYFVLVLMANKARL